MEFQETVHEETHTKKPTLLLYIHCKKDKYSKQNKLEVKTLSILRKKRH